MRAVSEHKKVVIKIGSAVLMREGFALDRGAFCRLVNEIAAASREGYEPIIVSSGAVAAGRRLLGMSKKPVRTDRSIPVLQALAALGQSRLIQLYDTEFHHYDLNVAQLLLTRDDFNDRRRYLNARNALEEVCAFGVIPVINENDTVATDEIRFGDNDQLAALVATMVGAELLVLLSDIDGLYSANPQLDRAAKKFDQVCALDPSLDAMVSDVKDPVRDGSGGMRTKLLAARIAARTGISTVIAPGKKIGVVGEVLAGVPGVGTVLTPERDGERLDARRAWIGLGVVPVGRISCDAGAVRAVCQKGKSLLPTGITGVEASFVGGDVVELVDPAGQAFARGITAYASTEVDRIKGVKSREIEGVLGFKITDAVVHRNDLMLLE